MNILLIGGAGSLIDNLIIKLNKAGHRVFLLTGSRFQHLPYQKVFERYDFSYDAECIGDVFESTCPDVTVFMGAYDTNFQWDEEEKAAVRFSASLTNLLMSYAMTGRGRFIFLSSEEVFDTDYRTPIGEEEPVHPGSLRGLALSQAENLCQSYHDSRKLDVITLRLDHLYSIPNRRREVQNLPAGMCLEALESNRITIIPENRFSLLYETDAVEQIFHMIECHYHEHQLYHITAGREMSEADLARMVKDHMGDTAEIVEKPIPGRKCVLSGSRLDREFGTSFSCDTESIVEKMANHMRANSYVFLTDEESKPTLLQRIMKASGWFLKAMIPFLENLICFAIVFFIYDLTMDSKYFAHLDLYLLYVLLFALVYGQQQATFSAVLASVGFCIHRLSGSEGLSVVLDANTYVWISQLFILGLAVGYMKDQIIVLKSESEEAKEYLSLQLTDIQDINTSNVRVKNALETQLVNQNDSVGKIYKITSALDYYSPEEVLFYAAEVISQLMDSKDVAVYTISNEEYARLFSATSKQARCMGNSIKYAQLGEMYEELAKHKVYINRKMDEKYPLMANAIFAEDRMQIMIFVWGIPWEHMTLGQANQLTVVSALIQDAVLRANRYLEVLENDRYIGDSRMLDAEAFAGLLHAYQTAVAKGLTECVVLKVLPQGESAEETGLRLSETLRQTDYMGILDDGQLYVLLSNTNSENAQFVVERFREGGFETLLVEEAVV